MQNLFSFPLVVDELSPSEKKYTLKATADDFAYLAEILKVPSVKSFEAVIFTRHRKKEHSLDVWGKVNAELELQSVVSLEYFTKKYNAEFESLYDTKATLKDLKELDFDFEDDIPEVIIDGKIDLVDVAIEQIALLMEDNPRKPGEKFNYKCEFSEEDTQSLNPFSVLSKLKK